MIRQKIDELREAIKKECGVESVDISIYIFSIDNGDGIDLFKAKEIGKKLKGELGGTLVTRIHEDFEAVSGGSCSDGAEFCVFT